MKNTIGLCLLINFSFFCSIVSNAEDLKAVGHDVDLHINVVDPVSSNIILPQTKSIKTISQSEVEVKLSPDEIEPFSFVLTSGIQEVSNVRLTVSDLIDKKNNFTLPADLITMRVVKAWYQGGTAWVNIGHTKNKKLVPELLLNNDSVIFSDHKRKINYLTINRYGENKNVLLDSLIPEKNRKAMDRDKYPIVDSKSLLPFNIDKNENKQIWGSVGVPKGTRPGVYSGLIKIFADNINKKEIYITVHVLPINLSKPKLHYSIYYRGQIGKRYIGNGFGTDWKTQEHLKSDLVNIKQHGFDSATIYQTMKDEDSLNINFELHSKLGISQDRLFYLGFNTDIKKFKSVSFFKENVSEVIRLAKHHSLGEVYFYGIDEGDDKEIYQQKSIWKIVQDLGGKILVAGNKKNILRASKSVDAYVVSGSVDKNLVQRAKKLSARGLKVYSYANPQGGVEDPLLNRRNFGLVLWNANYDGAVIYAYQHGEGITWSDYDGKHRDINFVYPTSDGGIIETIAWEGMREAIDDVRYFTTLEKMVKELSGEHNDLIDNARKFLMKIKSEKLNMEDPSFYRHQSIKHILELSKFTK